MSFAADDHESIAKRLKEIEDVRATVIAGVDGGESHAAGRLGNIEPTTLGEYAIGWPYTAAADYDVS